MDERDQRRKIRHRLAVLRHAEEVSGSVAATCRYYGISRTVFYKWRNRFEELGKKAAAEITPRGRVHAVYRVSEGDQRPGSRDDDASVKESGLVHGPVGANVSIEVSVLRVPFDIKCNPTLEAVHQVALICDP